MPDANGRNEYSVCIGTLPSLRIFITTVPAANKADILLGKRLI
jgi:hypothetical protein